MTRIFLLLALIIIIQENIVQPQAPICPSNADIWALLVAGSNGYENYRHQADVCHAYQVLVTHGIPRGNIVVMMYDDIASNTQNPFKGNIINRPNGPNVYTGVQIDYRREQVSARNFLNILQGNANSMRGIGSGKVIQSGPNTHVFVYYSDHGGPGLLAFPSTLLKARDLINVLTNMYNNKQYGQMVIYVEACESGSMFQGLLPNNYNIYVTTAANATQPSYSCYYDKSRKACLGDLYSVMWMEDSDAQNLTKETLQQQYILTRDKTTASNVQEFGDLRLRNLTVSEFQGRTTNAACLVQQRFLPLDILLGLGDLLPELSLPESSCKSSTSREESQTPQPQPVSLDPVPDPDVPLVVVMKEIEAATSEAEKEELRKKLEKMQEARKFIFDTMVSIVAKISNCSEQRKRLVEDHCELQNFECYESVMDIFSDTCFNLNKNIYAIRVLYILVNLCENDFSVKDIQRAMNETCTFPPVQGIQ